MNKRFENFGLALRHIRQSKGYSQTDLGLFAGFGSGQTISNCERGNAAISKPAMKAIIKKLKIDQRDRSYLLDALIEDARRDVETEWKGILI